MMPAMMPGWRRTLGRFARDRASALGLTLLLVLVLAAIFAPIPASPRLTAAPSPL